jgi:hypothetical protein
MGMQKTSGANEPYITMQFPFMLHWAFSDSLNAKQLFATLT